MLNYKKSLQELLSGIVPDVPDIVVTGITNDSREVCEGDLFLACVGETVDARKFIPEVVNKAAAVFYQKDDAYVPSAGASIPLIPIPHLNTLQGNIASRFYDDPSKTMRCIGVTGTNGKTTCTQWMAQALTSLGMPCGVVGTLGSGMCLGKQEDSALTTPDAVILQKVLASFQEQAAEAVAIEVSSHALAQGRVNGLCFDVAVYTQLSRDHLDFHSDMESYAAAKAKLFQTEGLRYAIINRDDAFGCRLAEETVHRCEVITYSLKGDAQASMRVTHIETTSYGFCVDVNTPWGEGQFKTRLLGDFNISNLLAVLGVLCVYGVSLEDALLSLTALQAIPGRMQLLGGKEGLPAVVVDYSHTPDALKKALTALREHCRGELWCVFGCGGDRDSGKRSEMAKAAETSSDHIIVTNDNPRTESPESIADDIMAGFSKRAVVKRVLDRADAIACAVQSAKQDDYILVAGKGHETYQIIGDKVLAFDDVVQVEKELFRRKK